MSKTKGPGFESAVALQLEQGNSAKFQLSVHVLDPTGHFQMPPDQARRHHPQWFARVVEKNGLAKVEAWHADEMAMNKMAARLGKDKHHAYVVESSGVQKPSTQTRLRKEVTRLM